MKKYVVICVLLLNSFFSGAIASTLSQCAGCHLGSEEAKQVFHTKKVGTKEAEFQCFACHYNLVNRVSIPGINKYVADSLVGSLDTTKSYLHLDKLNFEVTTTQEETIPRYTKLGLKKFLQQPISRYPFKAHNSMYALNINHINEIVSELDGRLSEVEPEMEDVSLNKGRALFDKFCQQCHLNSGPGPRLKLNYPLLSLVYFQAKVKGVVATENEKSVMPVFSELTSEDISSIYTYVSNSKTVKTASTERKKMVRFLLPSEIYDTVMVPTFSSSCRHCHGRNHEEQRDFEFFFERRYSVSTKQDKPRIRAYKKFNVTDFTHTWKL